MDNVIIVSFDSITYESLFFELRIPNLLRIALIEV